MIYIIMGVSGCGKSTLGTVLSERLGWPLYEGDDFHPQESINKMARGDPLTDEDRLPWLLKLHEVIEEERRTGSHAVVVCSALKRQYRQILLHGSKALTTSSCPDQEVPHPTISNVFFLFLNGDYNLIHQRIENRSGHFMNPGMLRSQFGTLEPPLDEENVLVVDIRKSIAEIATDIEMHLISLK
ncbi:putative gluconokinase [Genypterus blacodes]|uniref:putative gluconokinase n=1 Tax=Genypterus blacodes TaxID=154954 RepID=UPI003F7782E0